MRGLSIVLVGLAVLALCVGFFGTACSQFTTNPTLLNASSTSNGSTGSTSSSSAGPTFPTLEDQVESTIINGLLPGAAAMAYLCSPPGTDGFTNPLAMCTTPMPVIKGFADLLKVMGLTINPALGNGVGGNPGFVLLGHSNSLVAKSVTAINPRAIIYTSGVTSSTPTKPYNIISFTRGDEFAEIATFDPVNVTMNFYVVTFQKSCNLTNSCTPADLLTPEAEQNWINVRAFEDDGHTVPSLPANSIIDCQRCHQTGGPNSQAILRLQETTAPYTHFFWQASAGGKALLNDYFSAHPTTEEYAGIPGAMVSLSDPSMFANFITTTGFAEQPNPFPSATIEAQVDQLDPAQPVDNSIAGSSPAWNAIFAPYAQGLFNPPPYHDVKITDPEKLPALAQAYQSYMNGTLPAAELPDIRTSMKSDVQFMQDIGFMPVIGGDGAALLANACLSCHNSSLDQTLTRARFNAQTLSLMAPSEVKLAIQRIIEPANSPLIMPPAPFRSMTSDQITTLSGYLAASASIPIPTTVPAASPTPAPTPAQVISLTGLEFTCTGNIYSDNMSIQLIKQADGTYAASLTDLSNPSLSQVFTGVTLSATKGIQDYEVAVNVPLLYASSTSVVIDLLITPTTSTGTLNINQTAAGQPPTAFLSQTGLACTTASGYTPPTTLAAKAITPTPTPTPFAPTYTNVYNQVIAPNCLGCHSTGNAAAGISFSTYAATMLDTKIVTPGQPASSALYNALVGGTPSAPLVMPTGAPPLSPALTQLISDWITAGALNN